MNSIAFPTASHSYFKIVNLDDQRDSFIKNGAKNNPLFIYGDSFSSDVITRRVKQVDKDVFDLVEAGLKLQGNNFTKQDVDSFRKLNVKRFGKPSSDYVNAILLRVESAVDENTKALWGPIAEACAYDIEHVKTDSIWPSVQTFDQIKGYGQAYMKDLMQVDYKKGLHGLFNHVLDLSGLSKKGWALYSRDDASSAHVIHKRKRITVGSNYRPRNRRAIYRIIAHEVYGHALRGIQPSLKESEGFAILLEQLLDQRFKPRRMYRYLAAALGYGTTTDPMDFCQVYEVIWRCMVILSKYSESDAKSHAFSECARVFRGGRPDVAGAVYLKDTLYFAANMMFWQEFEKLDLSYNDFMDIANGSKRVLSE